MPSTQTGASRGARRDRAVRAAVKQGLVGDGSSAQGPLPVVALLDLAAITGAAEALQRAFAQVAAPGQRVLHAFAVKACPLVPVLRLLDSVGVGCEAASPGELALAGAAGVPAARTVLDSPAKTRAELREALALGVAVNADSPDELARLDELVGPGTTAPLGLRINPQLGGGTIAAMSTATATSKFGIGIQDPGAREWVLRAFAERPWLTRLHVHAGSQGVPLELMASAVRVLYELAEEINAAAGRQQVQVLDLGGGLPVNTASDEVMPGFEEYARLLARTVPGLFDGRYGLVTEFGRALLAKAGTVLARVEYAKETGGRRIAVTHAGAQLAVRTAFAPESWPLRVAAYGPDGRPKQGGEPVVQDVAGPCCFSGDLVARERPLPRLDEGDHAALLDTGAYYFATPFGYNALPRPAVWGYREQGGELRFLPVREAQTVAAVVAEAGAEHRDALIP